MILLILIINVFYRYYQKNFVHQLDKDLTSASDYALYIKGIPKSMSQENIKKFFDEELKK